MVLIRRIVTYAMIPANLLAIAWVWFGRIVFESAGWWMVIFTFTVAPVMFICLLLSTVLALTQRIPASRGHLRPAQCVAQVAVWLAAFGFGFFLVDFGDAPDSEKSAFTAVFASGALDLSNFLAVIFGLLAIAAYVWLLVLVIVGNVRRRREPPPTPFGQPVPHHYR